MRLFFVLLGLSIALSGCSSVGKTPKKEGTVIGQPEKAGAPSADKENPKDPSTASKRLFDSPPQNRRIQALVLPPDLVGSSSDTVEQNNARLANRQAVLPPVVGTEIVREDGRIWLHVDAEAETVWRVMKDFWALHKVELVEETPATGVMQTDWIDSGRAAADGSRWSIVRGLLNRVVGSGSVYDRFRVRLERDGEATNIYVTHQATLKKASESHSPAKPVDFEWVSEDDDPEKVAELLQAIVVMFELDRESQASG